MGMTDETRHSLTTTHQAGQLRDLSHSDITLLAHKRPLNTCPRLYRPRQWVHQDPALNHIISLIKDKHKRHQCQTPPSTTQACPTPETLHPPPAQLHNHRIHSPPSPPQPHHYRARMHPARPMYPDMPPTHRLLRSPPKARRYHSTRTAAHKNSPPAPACTNSPLRHHTQATIRTAIDRLRPRVCRLAHSMLRWGISPTHHN